MLVRLAHVACSVECSESMCDYVPHDPGIPVLLTLLTTPRYSLLFILLYSLHMYMFLLLANRPEMLRTDCQQMSAQLGSSSEISS